MKAPGPLSLTYLILTVGLGILDIKVSATSGTLCVKTSSGHFPEYREPLNAPFLNGLFSRGFSRGKTAQ